MAETSGEGLSGRLRRLRREGGVQPTEAGTASAPVNAQPHVTRQHVTQQHVTQSPATQHQRTQHQRTQPLPLALPSHLVRRLERERIVSPLASRATCGAPERLEVEDGVCARHEFFDEECQHGATPITAALKVRAEHVAHVAKDERLCTFDAGRALYLDIEATGLSGGSGTYPFLVALGGWDRSGPRPRFEVWQGFMTEPKDEPALLAEVARRVRDAGAIVTFFGKSYDRHRLEDKMRHHRIAPPFADVLHLDLYHPLRRLYRGSLPDGKLSTVERELCGVERCDDLSGAYAPAAWFDFLAGRPHLLEEVFRHNLDDVLSLVTLTAHLGQVFDESSFDGLELRGCGHRRAAELARLAAASGDLVRATQWYERALERGGGGLECDELRLELARVLERAGELTRARSHYAELLGAGDNDLVGALAGERLGLLSARNREFERAVDATRAALVRAEASTDPRAASPARRLRARLERGART